MSRISEVIKNKNKIEKDRKLRQKTELANIRSKTAFKARLIEQMKEVDVMLDDSSIRAVIISLKDTLVDKFSESIYSGELEGYEIEQLTANTFKIKKKLIDI